MSTEDWDESEFSKIPAYNVPSSGKSSSHHNSANSRNYNKRSSGYSNSRDSGNRSRTSRHYSFKDELVVPSQSIGLIIGRGGSNIQRIQDDYNVRVELNKGSGRATVSGNKSTDVKDAIDNIRKQLESSSSDNRRGRPKKDFNNEPSTSGHKEEQSNEDNPTKVNDLINPETGFIDWEEMARRSREYEEKRMAELPKIIKNFYNEAPEVAKLSPKEVARIRANNNNITVSRCFTDDKEKGKCDDIPNPVWKFEQCFKEYPDLLEEICKQNFKNPSPIQSQAWPVLLKGEDLIGIAQTGTGKTLAFLLPAMVHIEGQTTPRSERSGATVLILAPTRELALQLEKEVNKYSYRGIKAVCVYGGGDRKEQIDVVQRGVEIIICTPGRLNDLIDSNIVDVSCVTYLVLDEADRMLDMGFEPQIRKAMCDIRKDRQTVMTSATWPSDVRRLAQSYTKNPVQICVGSLDLAATHSVRQLIEILDDGDKYYTLSQFLKKMQPDDKIIIFCGKKSRVNDLSSDLALAGYKTTGLHGSREQCDREASIYDITHGYVDILVATDVASRGLDIEDITYVINYDFPRNIEEYVHRVGRTGRAGRTGTSISYVTRTDWGVAKELIDILEEANQEVPRQLRDMASRFSQMKERRKNEKSNYRSSRY